MNIANNPTIKKHLLKRWEELAMKPGKIMDDAEQREPSMHFSRSTFSRWSKGVKGGFSDKQILWLCTRWGIAININFGVPSLTVDNRLQWTIPPYDELACLQRLKVIFTKSPVVLVNPKKKPVKKAANKK